MGGSKVSVFSPFRAWVALGSMVSQGVALGFSNIPLQGGAGQLGTAIVNLRRNASTAAETVGRPVLRADPTPGLTGSTEDERYGPIGALRELKFAARWGANRLV